MWQFCMKYEIKLWDIKYFDKYEGRRCNFILLKANESKDNESKLIIDYWTLTADKDDLKHLIKLSKW